MKFLKMHGTGNDFVLIDRRVEAERDWPELARRICDRHFGVGADGILLVAPSRLADYRMIMYNPDGSEAEMCGNGIRCFAKYLYDTSALPGDEVSVETGAGVKQLRIAAEAGVARRVMVDMGPAEFEASLVPIAIEAREATNLPLRVDDWDLRLTAVSMGNPHAVHFMTDDPAAFPLEQVGPKVEHDPLFPRRVNFEIARVRSRHQIDVRVWERGAGITLACGTGACAVFAAAGRLGLVEPQATVSLPGGDLDMRLGPGGQVLMTGPATMVFSGEWREQEGT